jgi:Ca2+:H+ antiporter
MVFMSPFIAHPLLSALVLTSSLLWPKQTLLLWLAVPALVLAVLSSVHHAEVIAHKVGEPYGTLVLALAVTVIEVALVLSMMLGTTALLSSLAYGFQRYFESQIEEAQKLSQ